MPACPPEAELPEPSCVDVNGIAPGKMALRCSLALTQLAT